MRYDEVKVGHFFTIGDDKTLFVKTSLLNTDGCVYSFSKDYGCMFSFRPTEDVLLATCREPLKTI